MSGAGKIDLNTGDGLTPAAPPVGVHPVWTSERYTRMFERVPYSVSPPPRITQKQMRELSSLWDKAFIHFEQGSLQHLQEHTKKVLKPNEVWRSLVEKWTQGQNNSGNYNRAEEILAQQMAQHGVPDKNRFESQYRSVQEAAIYEQADAGRGVRDAAVMKEEPILVIGKYRDTAGAEHNVFATMNPVVYEYSTKEQVDEYNHFAERAKLPQETERVYRCFDKDAEGYVLYKVSIGTAITGEHDSKVVPRSQIGKMIEESDLRRIQEEASRLHHKMDISLRK